MPKIKLIKTSNYRGYRILANSTNPFIEAILNGNQYQLEAMLSRYSRVFTFRFDLRFPVGTEISGSETDLLRVFLRTLKYRLSTIEKGRNGNSRSHSKIAYGWCREIETSDKPHFHMWIALSGHKIRRTGFKVENSECFSGIAGIIQECWVEVGGSSNIHLSKGGARMLNRGDQEKLHECLYHYSYLAKLKGKAYGESRYQRNYGFSQLR